MTLSSLAEPQQFVSANGQSHIRSPITWGQVRQLPTQWLPTFVPFLDALAADVAVVTQSGLRNSVQPSYFRPAPNERSNG